MSASLVHLSSSLSEDTGGVGFRLYFLLISDSDSVDCCRATKGSVKSRIAVDMSLEFRKVVSAWWCRDFRNFAKLWPFCSVLVPKISISGILGIKREDGLVSPCCFATGGVVATGLMLILPVATFARFCVACTYYVRYVES